MTPTSPVTATPVHHAAAWLIDMGVAPGVAVLGSLCAALVVFAVLCGVAVFAVGIAQRLWARQRLWEGPQCVKVDHNLNENHFDERGL